MTSKTATKTFYGKDYTVIQFGSFGGFTGQVFTEGSEVCVTWILGTVEARFSNSCLRNTYPADEQLVKDLAAFIERAEKKLTENENGK